MEALKLLASVRSRSSINFFSSHVGFRSSSRDESTACLACFLGRSDEHMWHVRQEAYGPSLSIVHLEQCQLWSWSLSPFIVDVEPETLSCHAQFFVQVKMILKFEVSKVHIPSVILHPKRCSYSTRPTKKFHQPYSPKMLFIFHSKCGWLSSKCFYSWQSSSYCRRIVIIIPCSHYMISSYTQYDIIIVALHPLSSKCIVVIIVTRPRRH